MTERIQLDESVDTFAAKIVLTRSPDGSLREARFDLGALPRVESLLVGKQVAQVPQLVARLCGICPAAHHLAGVQALESLRGEVVLPPAARASRRLLHHGAVLEAHAARVLSLDLESASQMRKFARQAMAATGVRGHFPAVALPGGVAEPVDSVVAQELLLQGPAVLERAVGCASELIAAKQSLAAFVGLDLALVNSDGIADLLGSHVAARAQDGELVLDRGKPSQWADLVAEEAPGEPAPRPYLVALGPEGGSYRVGPVAQLRIGELSTPIAAELQQNWLDSGAGAAAARAVIAVHAIEVICQQAANLGDPNSLVADLGEVRAGTGVGWVDGPRGLLVHSYTAAADAKLTSASILTPTAQNESWLAAMLTRLFSQSDVVDNAAVEAAIRAADPCLPVVLAPEGAMGVQLQCV